MFLLILIGLIETFAGAAIMYFIGRILLPEIGLHAPDFWIWFWVMLLLEILGLIKDIIKEATS